MIKPKEPVHMLSVLRGCDEKNITSGATKNPGQLMEDAKCLKAGKPASECGDKKALRTASANGHVPSD